MMLHDIQSTKNITEPGPNSVDCPVSPVVFRSSIVQPAAAAVMAPQEVASKLPVMPVSGARKPATFSNDSTVRSVSFMGLSKNQDVSC